VSADGNSITVSFNASLSRGDTLSVGEYNRSAAVASGMQVLINGSTQTGKGGPTVPGLWVPVQIAAGATAGTVAVDISALRANGTAVHGVRYAWKENPSTVGWPPCDRHLLGCACAVLYLHQHISVQSARPSAAVGEH